MEEDQQQNQNNNNQPLVLVTGATGFVAGHVINVLLQNNYKVRGTVRSLAKKERYKSVYEIFPTKNENIELVEADLLNPDCWDQVMQGCDYVIHCASPFPSTVPKDEDEIIKPAVEGTKAVMTAAIKNNINKIVITSSIAAVFTGCKENNFSEQNWSNLDNSPAYEKSKHLAEKMAWNIYNQNQGKIRLTTINPGFIQGPNFHNNDFTSGDFVMRAMKNDILGIPKISLGMVDVRDVALAHVRAIQDEYNKTDGNRYILNEGSYWMEDSISVLRDEFKPKGYKLPSMTVNKLSFMCYACCDKSAALLKPFYGRMILFDNTKSKDDLGIKYINNRKTLIDMANDLIEKGRIPKKNKK